MNKNILYITIAIVVIAALYFLVFQKKGAGGNVDLSNNDFEQKMKEPDVVVVDVRSDFEYRGAKIPGAVHMNVNGPTFAQDIKNLDKDKTYLVYCATGNRSVVAYKMMKSAGIENVYNLTHGIEGWKRENKPVTR